MTNARDQVQDDPRTMKVAVDQDRCCGSGNCVMLVPEVFDQREQDGIVRLLDPAPGDELRDRVGEAADLCPAAAITITEEGA